MAKTSTDRFRSLARRYPSPASFQRWLRTLPYNREVGGETLRSALTALKLKTAHCLEAAFLTAAVFETRGYPPLVLSLESQDGLDHVLYVFQEDGRWGSIGRSRDEGLHGRPPVYRSLRELAHSYVEPYVDRSGRITGYGLAHLDDTGAPWRDSPRSVWKAEKYLIEMPHTSLITSDRKYRAYLKSYHRRGAPPPKKGWW